MKNTVNTAIVSVLVAILLVLYGITCYAQDMTKQERLKNTLYLQSNNYSSAKDGFLVVVDADDKTVVPKMRDEVFYVPLRYVLESFGAEVLWDDSVKSVIISADGNTMNLSVQQDVLIFDNDSVKLAYDCYIDNSRTYVALEDIPKIITCGTYYYTANKAAVIYLGEEWNAERDAEKQAHSAMEFAVSPFFKMFT